MRLQFNENSKRMLVWNALIIFILPPAFVVNFPPTFTSF